MRPATMLHNIFFKLWGYFKLLSIGVCLTFPLILISFSDYWPILSCWLSGMMVSIWLYSLAYAYHESLPANSTAKWSPFTSKNKNQSSPYECGFAPMTLSRLPFSLRFYLVSILFIIFDVEVILLSSVPICIRSGALHDSYASIFVFVLVMYLGLMYEAFKGALNWSPADKNLDGNAQFVGGPILDKPGLKEKPTPTE